MALGVCLLFDHSAERTVRWVWDRVESRGVPSLRSHTHGRHRPHLSYVVLVNWELDELRSSIEALAHREPFDVTFDAIGMFRRGRVSLVPGMSADLLVRQREVFEAAVRAGAVVHQHYEPGRWLPHCAIAPRVELERVPVVAEALYEVLPLTLRVSRAALIDSGTGTAWMLDALP